MHKVLHTIAHKDADFSRDRYFRDPAITIKEHEYARKRFPFELPARPT